MAETNEVKATCFSIGTIWSVGYGRIVLCMAALLIFPVL